MTLTRSTILVVAAVVCFTIALLMSLAVISGGSQQSWEIGGFLALALSFLP